MVKDINNLKRDMMAITKVMIGEKPLVKHVKELTIVINNAKAIECVVGKIIAMEK